MISKGVHVKSKKVISRLGLLAGVIILLSCAATQTAVPDSPDLPGFFLGIWHGFISPITFFISLFSDTVRIYAFPNNGGWYNFGFMLGIGGFSGGIFAGSRKK